MHHFWFTNHVTTQQNFMDHINLNSNFMHEGYVKIPIRHHKKSISFIIFITSIHLEGCNFDCWTVINPLTPLLFVNSELLNWEIDFITDDSSAKEINLEEKERTFITIITNIDHSNEFDLFFIKEKSLPAMTITLYSKFCSPKWIQFFESFKKLAISSYLRGTVSNKFQRHWSIKFFRSIFCLYCVQYVIYT